MSLISAAMNQRMNEQIGHEMGASQHYLAVSCQLDGLGLKALAARFREQAEEERGHALKFLDYIMETGGKVQIGALPKPPHDYPTVLAAIEGAVGSELTVTRQINELMELAEREKDFAARSFLQWFVDEQIEEVSSMTHLAQVARLAGENLLQIESYVRHQLSVEARGGEKE